jgi:hypothetical protein
MADQLQELKEEITKAHEDARAAEIKNSKSIKTLKQKNDDLIAEVLYSLNS